MPSTDGLQSNPDRLRFLFHPLSHHLLSAQAREKGGESSTCGPPEPRLTREAFRAAGQRGGSAGRGRDTGGDGWDNNRRQHGHAR